MHTQGSADFILGLLAHRRLMQLEIKTQQAVAQAGIAASRGQRLRQIAAGHHGIAHRAVGR